jgi:hypothetical protein
MLVHDLYLCYFMPPCNHLVFNPNGITTICCEINRGEYYFTCNPLGHNWGLASNWVIVPLN